MHSSLSRAHAGVDLYSTLLIQTSGDVRKTILVLSKFFESETTEELKKFYHVLSTVPKEVGDRVRGNACAELEMIESKLEELNSNLKRKCDAGVPFEIPDIAKWLETTREYISCHLDGVENTIISS